MTLAEFADLALQNNPAASRAWNEARAAAAQVDQAQGLFMPTVTAVAEADRQYTSAHPSTFDDDHLKYGPSLVVSYLILNFGGGRKAAVEQALQTVYAADFAFNRTLQDALLNVETAYYNLVSSQARIEAARANVKDATTALTAAQERKNAGTGTQLEVLQAQAGCDQARYGLANAEGLAQIAKGLLATAVGLPADTPLQVAPPTTELPDTFNVQDMRQLLDDALGRRPDIASLRAALAAKEAAVKVTGAALWPSLYLNGGVGYEEFVNESDRTLQDRDWNANAGISLRWTLFDGDQTRSARRAAMALSEAARAQLRQAELAASSEVWNRFAFYETAIQKYAFSTAFLQSATASYELALDSYKAGLRSFLDLLSAESLVADARSQQITARQEAFTALAALAHATGLMEKGGSAHIGERFSTIKKDASP
jgi:outer membrane protein TolC